MEELVELMKGRGIKRFVHFHTDHWEPFTGSCGGEWGDMASENADVILRFIEETTNHPFFDKMTLFYNHPIRTSHHEVMDEDTKDMLYFEPIDDKFWERYEFAVRKVATDTNHEFQVHIHHEGVTTGEYFKWAHLPWKEEFKASTTNSERFERYLKISLQELHRIVDLDLEKWHFLHGVWALNASDTDVCNVNDEIEILIRNGCIGDFSMPAGRSWVNSTTLAPHTVIPNNVPKGYDTEKADIKLIGENISKENKRFLIWNQEIPYSHCSIDLYGNETIMEALENYIDTIALWIKTSPIIGDTAFIKTHAHTMNRFFWENGGERPYDFPDVIRLFSTLKSVCEQADVDYEKWTVSEVITYLEKYDGALTGAFNRLESNMLTEKSLIPEGVFEFCSLEILEFLLQEREANDGEIYQWYETRYISVGVGLSIIEREIAEFVLKKFGNSMRVVEVGAGVGQCSILLAACGVTVAPIEGNDNHFGMMERLCGKVADKYEILNRNFFPINGVYPEVSEEAIAGKPSILMFPSISWTQTKEEEEEAMKAMKMAKGIILGLTWHFRERSSEEEKQELIDRIMMEGFSEPEDIFSWDDWSFGFRPDRIVYMENKQGD